MGTFGPLKAKTVHMCVCVWWEVPIITIEIHDNTVSWLIMEIWPSYSEICVCMCVRAVCECACAWDSGMFITPYYFKSHLFPYHSHQGFCFISPFDIQSRSYALKWEKALKRMVKGSHYKANVWKYKHKEAKRCFDCPYLSPDCMVNIIHFYH